MRSHNEIQQEYKARKIQTGYKRTQIWKLDESNKSVQQRIKIACIKINQNHDEDGLIEEISAYTHNLLQDTPL